MPKPLTQKQQPCSLERAYNHSAVRCFYCRSLLLITDDEKGRKAWRWKQKLDAAKAAKAQETV